MSVVAWNFAVLALGAMAPVGLLLYPYRSRIFLRMSQAAALTVGAFVYVYMPKSWSYLFAFYALTYSASTQLTGNPGAGLLVTSATVGFWEIPLQMYRYLGWVEPSQFSGWTWNIHSAAIVYALLWIAKVPLREAAKPLILLTVFNACFLAAYPAMWPNAWTTWYVCRALTAATLTGMVKNEPS